MSSYKGPLPIRTTNGGLVVHVGRAETGDQEDVEIVFYRTDDDATGRQDQQVFELLPSAAREIAEYLVAAADAIDSDYPGREKR